MSGQNHTHPGLSHAFGVPGIPVGLQSQHSLFKEYHNNVLKILYSLWRNLKNGMMGMASFSY